MHNEIHEHSGQSSDVEPDMPHAALADHESPIDGIAYLLDQSPPEVQPALDCERADDQEEKWIREPNDNKSRNMHATREAPDRWSVWSWMGGGIHV